VRSITSDTTLLIIERGKTMKGQKSNLSERAMLVTLKVHLLRASVKDKTVTHEVVTAKKATEDAGGWTTHMLPKGAMYAVTAAASQIKQAHNMWTLPWMDGGMRILPSELFMKYSESMRKAQQQFEKAVREFLHNDYPRLRLNAHQRLAGLLNSDVVLPTAEEARQKFSIDHNVLPLPDATDFRVNLGDEQVKSLKKNVARSIEAMTKKAVGDLYQQLGKMIERIVKQTSGEKKQIYDSLISNLKDLCDTIPLLNLTDDPNLEELRKECVSKLARLKPDDLREDKGKRKKAHKNAEEIMAKLQGYSSL